MLFKVFYMKFHKLFCVRIKVNKYWWNFIFIMDKNNKINVDAYQRNCHNIKHYIFFLNFICVTYYFCGRWKRDGIIRMRVDCHASLLILLTLISLSLFFNIPSKAITVDSTSHNIDR